MPLLRRKGSLTMGVAGTTGLEPATSDVTGRRSNQLNYVPFVVDTSDIRRISRRGLGRPRNPEPFLMTSLGFGAYLLNGAGNHAGFDLHSDRLVFLCPVLAFYQ